MVQEGGASGTSLESKVERIPSFSKRISHYFTKALAGLTLAAGLAMPYEVGAAEQPVMLDRNKTTTWNWTNQYQLVITTTKGGTVDVTNEWFDAGVEVGINAISDSNNNFGSWEGDVK